MNTRTPKRPLLMARRQSLQALGGAGASLLLGSYAAPANAQAAFACVLMPEMTEGPYWVDEKLNRNDIRVDPSDGSIRPGTLLNLTINVHAVTASSCGLLSGAYVDIWHCDAGGLYSDESANGTVGKKFLRGYQITDGNGTVNFQTIYPGWYSGRTVHIHLRIRTYSGSQVLGNFTSQLYFDDAVTDEVFSQSPYNTRGARNTRNSNDSILRGASNSERTMLTLAKTATGYDASIDLGVNLPAPAASRPAISTGGVVNAASFQSSIAPGSWLSIFGQNLSTSTKVVTQADLVNGALPVSFGGVSVQINNKAAFLHYVSPGQINAQAPADDSVGQVQVTVTNSAGTSDAGTATLAPIAPGFFPLGNYVAAVRADGTILTGATSAATARTGDVLQLYATGFGPAEGAPGAGVVFEGAYAVTNAVSMTIGGLSADVLYAGLVAAGLYQLNVTVPALSSGDHEIVATVAGLRTQSGMLLKVAS